MKQMTEVRPKGQGGSQTLHCGLGSSLGIEISLRSLGVFLLLSEGHPLSNTHHALTSYEDSHSALVTFRHIHSIDNTLHLDGEGLHDLSAFPLLLETWGNLLKEKSAYF